MLVIDSIELTLADQPGKMWKFEGDCAGGREEELKAGDEVVEVRHVGQDIVRHDEISGKITPNASRCVSTEERYLGRNTLLDGRTRDVSGRFDTQNIQSLFPKEPKQCTIVARDLHNP